ncbi:MAG: translation elongation factor Ts [Clostridiales bacterium]|nr:translation elongation factor Ts [Clostridiales bacterium]
MAFTAKDVKELREMTGCGMMDCKKALTETDGDKDKAVELLREKGLATAAKKAGRVAAEGIVKAYIDGNVGVLVEVNAETDFVAKNDEFQEFVTNVAKTVASAAPADVEELKAAKFEDTTIGDLLTAKIAKIGENMNIRRFARIATDGVVVEYIHAAGKIGVLVEAEAQDNDEVRECLKNIAMQIAALNPKYLSSDDVPADYKEHEKEILMAQAKNDPKNASKPENIIEKMITGRLAKELKEVCLLEQEYVKAENKESVAKYIDQVAKTAGAIKVKQFVRFETGEGLEKREDDFAAEVASMIK